MILVDETLVCLKIPKIAKMISIHDLDGQGCKRISCFPEQEFLNKMPSKLNLDTSSAGLLEVGTRANQGTVSADCSSSTVMSTSHCPKLVAPAPRIKKLLAAPLSK